MQEAEANHRVVCEILFIIQTPEVDTIDPKQSSQAQQLPLFRHGGGSRGLPSCR
jgi:hypothetical protein